MAAVLREDASGKRLLLTWGGRKDGVQRAVSCYVGGEPGVRPEAACQGYEDGPDDPVPYPDEEMEAYPVGPPVNSPSINLARCIE